MAKRRQNKKKAPKKPAAPPEESRAAEAATVGWMLSVSICLMCEVAAVLCWSGRRFWPDSEALGAIYELVSFSAIVIGLISLLMLPVVLKSRVMPPPTNVTITAIVVAALPVVIRLLRLG